jgi:hypothetical protein
MHCVSVVSGVGLATLGKNCGNFAKIGSSACLASKELKRVVLEGDWGPEIVRWSVPRELLWALIGSLLIMVLALWPTQYPYKQETEVSSRSINPKVA